MDRTACTEPQCLYNGALTFTYTCTPPMDRTACTEPQCLYKGALYVFTLFYVHGSKKCTFWIIRTSQLSVRALSTIIPCNWQYTIVYARLSFTSTTDASGPRNVAQTSSSATSRSFVTTLQPWFKHSYFLRRLLKNQSFMHWPQSMFWFRDRIVDICNSINEDFHHRILLSCTSFTSNTQTQQCKKWPCFSCLTILLK